MHPSGGNLVLDELPGRRDEITIRLDVVVADVGQEREPLANDLVDVTRTGPPHHDIHGQTLTRTAPTPGG
jgi:hypothetical protein